MIESPDLTDEICRSVTLNDLRGLTLNDLRGLSLEELNISNLINIFKQKYPFEVVEESISLCDINSAYNNGELVLVLGSGVSKGSGLPDWSGLLKKLRRNLRFAQNDNENQSLIMDKIFLNLFDIKSELIIARNIQQRCRLRPNMDESIIFERFVRCALYRGTRLKYTQLLKEIIRLCSFYKDKKVLDSVITYNYDDILEYYLNIYVENSSFKPIYFSGIKNDKSLPIYHVHGFLPRSGNLSSKNRIILGEETYHILYNKLSIWNNKVQINKFKNNTCLLVGLSLTDPNLRRLLDTVNKKRTRSDKYHYIIRFRPSNKEIEDDLKKLLKNDSNLLKEKNSAGLEFDETVKIYKDMKCAFLEEDALSLGLRTIWADSKDEIVKILRLIRLNST